ncbi:hypothetical protein Hanom_Chr14g01314641 [Helianthus anomalus]
MGKVKYFYMYIKRKNGVILRDLHEYWISHLMATSYEMLSFKYTSKLVSMLETTNLSIGCTKTIIKTSNIYTNAKYKRGVSVFPFVKKQNNKNNI